MESKRFDRMARLFGAGEGTGTTRRGALAAILAAGVLGVGSDGEARKRRRKRKRKDNGNTRDGQTVCIVRGPGQDLSGCDFTGRDLRGTNLSGSNLRATRFANADLCAADLSGANLAGTDFSGANLIRADLRGTNLPAAIVAGALFCQTRLPDDRRDDSGCPTGDGNVCCGDADCAGGRVCRGNRCVCPDGTVELGNGSCATPCTPNSCSGSGCRCNRDFDDGDFCESDMAIGIVCADNSGCPAGSVCVPVNTTTKVCRLTCDASADCPVGSACAPISPTTKICQQLCPPRCDDEFCLGDSCNYTGYPCGGLFAPPCCPGLFCRGFPFFVCDPTN